MAIVNKTLRRLNAQCKHPNQTRKVKLVFDFSMDGNGNKTDHMFDLCTEIHANTFVEAMVCALTADTKKHGMSGKISGTIY